MIECDKPTHRFEVVFWCRICDRSVTKKMEVVCSLKRTGTEAFNHTSLRRIACSRCKDSERYGLVYLFCRSGASDSWNGSSVRASARNVDDA